MTMGYNAKQPFADKVCKSQVLPVAMFFTCHLHTCYLHTCDLHSVSPVFVMSPDIIDLSPPLSPETPVWPGDPRVVLRQPFHLARGDDFTLTELAMSAHTGTHVDAPAHYLPDAAGVDQLPLDVLIGPARVVDIGDAGLITASTLDRLAIPPGTERVLFLTRNTARGLMRSPRFHTDFVALAADGAQWLVDRGVRLVGVDYLSIAPYDALAPTHRILLKAGVVIVEGLDMTDVEPGDYTLVCLPLKLQGAEGAPARAILLKGRFVKHE